eukprot:CAMPEP_0197850014 /NCGR_PEP_ID=MMETSP1438-20131217/13970_1 /TAXON_ID=1461541 /ORGANISM="Pterosperma sp., Strain CCMP1384" /LENGTH=317 /DNA_ID=CAMNT_0043462957 /DNA_START=145 /DNA_END=1098 /DNA_ORIENTATION=+
MPLEDMTGKVAIVTGSNTGIGKATAAHLCSAGAHVILACRSLDKAEEAAKEISAGASGTAEAMRLDLSDLQSVEAFAKEFLKKHDKLHALVNNGGLNTDGDYKGPKTTSQGFEICFGTNHLGHFALTLLLLPTLKKSGHARIVNLSSITIWFSSTKWHNYYLGPAKTKGNYACSKMMVSVFGKELARRLKDTDITVVNADPGYVASTIWRNDALMAKVANILALSPEQGARTSIEAVRRIDVDSGALLLPFTFAFSSIMKTAPSMGYNLGMPLLSKMFHGCKPDIYPKKACDASSAEALFELSYKCLKEHNIKVEEV